jgi:lysozyme family protein
MANFDPAYEKILQNEGSYSNDPNDPGGETYKGVSRCSWNSWKGWQYIDLNKLRPGFPANLEKEQDLQAEVKQFYLEVFWSKINGEAINNQTVATSVFDFAVNAGAKTSTLLVQTVVGANQDGVLGDHTLQLLNDTDPEHFLASFALAKIVRYISIVKKRPASQKYFYGWVCRTLEAE